jgi:hypothetical protein
MATTQALKSFDQEIERLIQISKDKPLLPESFIPWATELEEHFELMPKTLLSLYGHELFNKMTNEQKRELARAEIAQVMYSYAWSEELACLFFFRYVSSLKHYLRRMSLCFKRSRRRVPTHANVFNGSKKVKH